MRLRERSTPPAFRWKDLQGEPGPHGPDEGQPAGSATGTGSHLHDAAEPDVPVSQLDGLDSTSHDRDLTDPDPDGPVGFEGRSDAVHLSIFPGELVSALGDDRLMASDQDPCASWDARNRERTVGPRGSAEHQPFPSRSAHGPLVLVLGLEHARDGSPEGAVRVAGVPLDVGQPSRQGLGLRKKGDGRARKRSFGQVEPASLLVCSSGDPAEYPGPGGREIAVELEARHRDGCSDEQRAHHRHHDAPVTDAQGKCPRAPAASGPARRSVVLHLVVDSTTHGPVAFALQALATVRAGVGRITATVCDGRQTSNESFASGRKALELTGFASGQYHADTMAGQPSPREEEAGPAPGTIPTDPESTDPAWDELLGVGYGRRLWNVGCG